MNSAIISNTDLCRARAKVKQFTSENKIPLLIIHQREGKGKEEKGRERFCSLITGLVLIGVVLMGNCKTLDIGRRDVGEADKLGITFWKDSY